MTVRLTNDVPLNYSRAEWIAIVARLEEAMNALYAGSLVGRASAAAAPTTGSWARGDVIFNNAPSAGGQIGWVCVSAGSPGTWKAWGTIAA